MILSDITIRDMIKTQDLVVFPNKPYDDFKELYEKAIQPASFDLTLGSGFKYPKKSHNKDMLLLVQTSIIKSGHLVTFIDNDDFKIVNTWEEKYGNKTNNKSNKSYARPSIENKKNPNDVFKHDEQASATPKDWREMYSDLMSDSHGAWVPGSGGY